MCPVLVAADMLADLPGHSSLGPKSSADFRERTWAKSSCRPAFDGSPVTAAGGMGPLNPGASGFVTQDLDPGRYLFICVIPNAEGTAHMALGMLHEFSVE